MFGSNETNHKMQTKIGKTSSVPQSQK